MPHARLAVARATYLNGDFAKAAKLFAEMERYPSLREQSLVIQAQCLKESGKTKEMVAVVEKLIADGITTTGRAGAALMLAQARAMAGEYDKLAALARATRRTPAVGRECGGTQRPDRRLG